MSTLSRMHLTLTEFKCGYCHTILNLYFKEIICERKEKKWVPPGARDLGLIDVWESRHIFDLGFCPNCKANYWKGDGLSLRFQAIDHSPNDEELCQITLSNIHRTGVEDSIKNIITKTLNDYDVKKYPHLWDLRPKEPFNNFEPEIVKKKIFKIK